MKKENVYLRCLERWSATDKRISYFEANFDEWFSQLPEDIHEVVFKLLEIFEYYLLFQFPQDNLALSAMM